MSAAGGAVVGTSVHEVDAGAGRLRGAAAPPDDDGGALAAALADCGFVLRSLTWVVSTLTGRDPVAELVEPLSGDLGALRSMQTAWLEVAATTGAVGANYRGLGGQLPGVWQGEAATAAVGLTDRVAAQHESQDEAATMLAEQLGHLAEVSEATVQLVLAVADFLADLVAELLLEAAAGPLGWAKAAATSPGRVARVVRLLDQGRDAISELVRVVGLCIGVLRQVEALLDLVAGPARGAEALAHAGAATGMADVAEAGFGQGEARP